MATAIWQLFARPDYEPGSWLVQIKTEIGAIEEATGTTDEREIVAEWVRPDAGAGDPS